MFWRVPVLSSPQNKSVCVRAISSARKIVQGANPYFRTLSRQKRPSLKYFALSMTCSPAFSNMAETSSQDTPPGPVQSQIEHKLQQNLDPVHFLEVVNESYKHNVPKGAEKHFKVFVVSPVFQGKSLLERSRMVHRILDEELKSGVHALSISAKTPGEYMILQS